MTPEKALQEAIELAGGKIALAQFLNIKLPAVYQWKRAPAARVLKIEEAARGKITRHQLRPDIYPPEAS